MEWWLISLRFIFTLEWITCIHIFCKSGNFLFTTRFPSGSSQILSIFNMGPYGNLLKKRYIFTYIVISLYFLVLLLEFLFFLQIYVNFCKTAPSGEIYNKNVYVWSRVNTKTASPLKKAYCISYWLIKINFLTKYYNTFKMLICFSYCPLNKSVF